MPYPLAAARGHNFGAPASPYHLLDHFTGTNGADLTAHPMDVGPGWTQFALAAVTPAWQIQGNQAKQTVTDVALSFAFAAAESGAADGTLEADLALPGSGGFAGGLCFRKPDATHFWWASLDTDGHVYLFEYDGSSHIRASAAYTPPAGTTIVLQVVLLGNSITVKVDGVTKITHSSSVNATATVHGLAAYYGVGYTAQITFDDFEMPL